MGPRVGQTLASAPVPPGPPVRRLHHALPCPACPSPAHRVPSPRLVPHFQLVPRLESAHRTRGDGPGITAGSSASMSLPPREVHLLAWPVRDVGTRSPAQERRRGCGLSTQTPGVGRAAGVYTGCSCCRRRSSRQQQKLAPATGSDHRSPTDTQQRWASGHGCGMWPCRTGSHGRAGGHSQGPCSSLDPDSDPDLAVSPVGPSLVFPSSLRFSEGSPAQLWSRYPAQTRLYHLGPFLGIWAPPWVWETLPGHWGSPWVWETLPGHWGSSLEETQGMCCGRPPDSKGRSCQRLEHHQGRGPAQGPSLRASPCGAGTEHPAWAPVPQHLAP